MSETITAMASRGDDATIAVHAKDGEGMRPRARSERLVIRRLEEDETLVYDLQSHRAHCLNRTVDSVWHLCDGRRSVADIARALRPASPAPPDSDVVLFALGQLREADLLVDTVDEADLPSGPSRRELLVRLGRGAVVWLPLVTSIVAPTAAQAASPTCKLGEPIRIQDCKQQDPDSLGCCCDTGFRCADVGAGNWICNGTDPPCP
jgi:hypothetical protein